MERTRIINLVAAAAALSPNDSRRLPRGRAGREDEAARDARRQSKRKERRERRTRAVAWNGEVVLGGFEVAFEEAPFRQLDFQFVEQPHRPRPKRAPRLDRP